MAASFVATHSELFKEQKAGDADATEEGCFPPAEMMGTDRARLCVAVLSRLFEERKDANAPRLRSRIFWVRDRSLHPSLEGFDTDKGLADLKIVADYMLLPKCLNEALELEGAVVKAKRDYQAAIGGYNLLTATSAKPRLFDFLVKSDKLIAIISEEVKHQGGANSFGAPFCCLTPGASILSVYSRGHGFNHILRTGMIDGLMGESLSEYGFTPSAQRMLAYASGCVIARRPIPASVVHSPADESATDADLSFVARARDPCSLAARSGNLPALQDLYARGFGRKKPIATLMRLVAASGSREAVEWVCSLDPAACKAAGAEAFEEALRSGHFDMAKWLVEAFDLRASGVQHFDLERCMIHAAKHNNLDALKWLHLELGLPLRTEVKWYACTHNNREMLDWYFSKAAPGDGCAWEWEAFCAALRSGHLEMGLLLLQKGRPKEPLSYEALADACEGFKGDTAVLDGIMAIQPPLAWEGEPDEKFESLAATACERGYPHVLEWILRQRPSANSWFRHPDSQHFCDLLRVAVQHAQTECVRWLLAPATKERLARMAARLPQKPSPVDEVMGHSLAHRPLPSREMLELLAPHYDLSCFYQAAITAADPDLVRWLSELGCKLRLFDADDEEEDDDDEGDDYDDDDDDYYYDDNVAREERYERQAEKERIASDVQWRLSTLLQAGECARPKCLEFLRALGEEGGLDFGRIEECRDSVAQSGSVEMMQLVTKLGAEPSLLSELQEAAKHGHLPMCRWLRQQGAAWPPGIVEMARAAGASEVAEWAEQEQAREKAAGSV